MRPLLPLLALIFGLLAVNPGTADTTPASVDLGAFTTTASGLRYVDRATGHGPRPQPGEIAQIRYTGWLFENGARGDAFDSNTGKGGKLLSFPVGKNRAIPAWDEAVSTMQAGGKRTLIVPPELGYGDRGAGGLVPPGATLMFDIELVAIKPRPAKPDLDHPI